MGFGVFSVGIWLVVSFSVTIPFVFVIFTGFVDTCSQLRCLDHYRRVFLSLLFGWVTSGHVPLVG